MENQSTLPDPNLPEIESNYPNASGDGKKHPFRNAIVGVVTSFTLLSILVILAAVMLPNNTLDPIDGILPDNDRLKLSQFASEEEFREYISEASDDSFFGANSFRATADFALESSPSITSGSLQALNAGGGVPTRVSDTNVQVAGIDEPDIVKTDGQNIFFSSQFFQSFPISEPLILEDDVSASELSIEFAPRRTGPQTKVIDSFPPSKLAEVANIDESGDLLLDDNNLLVFSHNKISGYNVSDRANPTSSWELNLEDNNQIVSSRLKDGKVYMVTRTFLNRYSPCPMPIIQNGLTVPCTSVWRPGSNISADSTYTVMKINPSTGQIEDNVSFVGSNAQTVVYQSATSIYITYTVQPSIIEVFADFFTTDESGLFPESVVTDIKRIANLDISEQSKMIEFLLILENYQSSLDPDERKRIENELEDKMTDYMADKGRELQTTGVAKINTSNLEIAATGEFPGIPLNQFSLDEYNGNLRVATTINPRTFFGSAESANDVFVLDGSLNTIGSVLNLGLDERIYSARFIGDVAYVVTFKQIDPFYVINLSDPKNPKVEGELKIPGFSSYLHPIADNIILGVGQEEFRPKLSMFDVSNPNNPLEVDKYNLSDGWTEVQSNHHAFLHDPEHGIFFLPAGQSGYIFRYENNKFNLVKAVADINAKRAIFINDYLYVIGDEKIVILNENDWEEVNQLVF